MDASQNQVIFYGSGFNPGSGSSVSGISGSNLSAISSLSAFSSTPSGTLTITGSPSVSLSAGTIISLDGSSSSAFFVVVEDYSGGSSLKVTFIPTAYYSSNTTSVSSISGMKQYGSASVSSGYAGPSISADTTMKFNESGSSNTAVFMAKSAISSSSPILVVVDPRDDLSSGISTFPGSTTYGGSSQTSGGSITEAASRVAWANLYVDAIDLDGQGSISMGGTGRIDLDADDDTSIRASADDVITFDRSFGQMSMSSAMLYPASSDGLALGGTSNMWSDLFLASGGVVNFSAGDVTVTHSSGQLAVSDSLVISDHADSSVGLVLGSTAITATGAELNIMDGGTSDSAVTLEDGDHLVINDGGTMAQTAVTSLAPYLAGDGLNVSSNKLVITSKNESKAHAGSAAQEIALSSKVFTSGNSQASASTFSGSSVTFRILKADRVHSPVAGKQITVGSYTATISSVTTETVSSTDDAWEVVLGSGSGSSGSATTISFAKDGTFL